MEQIARDSPSPRGGRKRFPVEMTSNRRQQKAVWTSKGMGFFSDHRKAYKKGPVKKRSSER